jgi:DMSO/TMAO reductase YedYZ molybdopterin-dependent catalytic subunit
MNKPRLPPGQHLTTRFPVLHVGSIPKFDPETWDFLVDGEVSNKLRFTWEEFKALPKTVDVSDFHCVTSWSRLDCKWGGVKLNEIIRMAQPKEGVTTVLASCDGGYTTDFTLQEGMKDNVLLAYELDGKPLPPEHGGPLRLVTPDLYAYKAAKWLRKITFLDEHVLGFWESRGYSDTADPWKEERYAGKRQR